MELYQKELRDATSVLVARGRDQTLFSFTMSYHPPDPDGAGMFTVKYEVTISNQATLKSLVTTGGIGFRWVDEFEAALEEGYFD